MWQRSYVSLCCCINTAYIYVMLLALLYMSLIFSLYTHTHLCSPALKTASLLSLSCTLSLSASQRKQPLIACYSSIYKHTLLLTCCTSLLLL